MKQGFLSREPPSLPKKTQYKTMCMKQQSREKFWTGSCWAVFEEADKTCLVDNTGEELSDDVSVCVVCLYKHTHVTLLYAHVQLQTHIPTRMHIYTYTYTNAHGNPCPWYFVLSHFEMLEMNSLFIWGLPSLVVPADEWGKGTGNSFSIFWASESFPCYHILFDDAH